MREGSRARYKEQLKLAKEQGARLIRVKVAEDYFGLARTTLMKYANECDAVIEVNNNMVWIDREVLENYLLSFRKATSF
ncbi:MAG: hypothetical protein IIZ20_11640 [Butyrivibrio sp.]|nr:hypothetical protein [Butyrivibrio sp.]